MTLEQDLRNFEPLNDGCGSQVADGRLVLAPITSCDKPTVYNLVSPDTDVVAPADEVEVTITGANADTVIFLQAGRVVVFGTTVTVVRETTRLVGVAPQIIPIEPLTTDDIVADSIAEVVSALEVISVGELPINFSADTENDDRLASGIQGDSSITKIRAQSPVSLFVRSDDAGTWEKGFLFSSGTGIVTLYALVSHANEKLHVFGKVQFQSLEFSNASASLKKITSTMVFKPPYYPVTHFDYLDTPEQGAVNRIRNRFGLASV